MCPIQDYSSPRRSRFSQMPCWMCRPPLLASFPVSGLLFYGFSPVPQETLSWMPLSSRARPGEPLSPGLHSAVTLGQWFSTDGDFASKETSGDVWGRFWLKPLEEGHCWYLVGGPAMLPNLLQGTGWAPQNLEFPSSKDQ